MRNEDRLRRIEQLTDLPLFVLAVAMIPLLVIPLIADVGHSFDQAFLAADWFIWAAFATDFGVKLVVAPEPFTYARRHWLEALMVVLPFLRPLRTLRLLRLGRLLVVLGMNVELVSTLVQQRGTKFILGAVLGTSVAGAMLTFLSERRAPEANITSFGDSLWWSISTMTTVGYGDRFPVTALGRGVAVALMLFGIAALSALTATIAAYLVRQQEGAHLGDVMHELRALREEVARLQRDA